MNEAFGLARKNDQTERLCPFSQGVFDIKIPWKTIPKNGVNILVNSAIIGETIVDADYPAQETAYFAQLCKEN